MLRPLFNSAAGFKGSSIVASEEARSMKYSEYQHLLFEHREDGVLLVTLNRPDVLNATNARLHWELTQVWKDVADDPETRVVLVTGAGKAFSAGGDLEMISAMA